MEFPFGKSLREILNKEDRSASWLASRLGLDQSTVNRWLNEQTRPGNVQIIIRIAKIFDIVDEDLTQLIRAAGYEYFKEVLESSPTVQPSYEAPSSLAPEPTLSSLTLPVSISLDAAQDTLAQIPLDDVPPVSLSLPIGSSVIPFSPNSLFVGRDEELRELAEMLKGDGTTGPVTVAAITGVGGMGKTQLAVEFVHRYGAYFAGGVFWVNMEIMEEVEEDIEHSAICQAIVKAGRQMPDLPVNFSEMMLEDQISIILGEWQEPVPRLIVFDNCEDPEMLDQWRPKTGGSRLLLTSRRVEWDSVFGVKALSLKELERKQSISLLHKSREERQKPPFSEKDQQFLDEIANELGDLPLALHLAGYYLARMYRTVKPEDYLERLREINPLQHRSLQKGDTSPTKHEQNVARTFMISYEQLNSEDATDALSIQLLVHAACFAPGVPIPYDLLLATINTHEEDNVHEDDEENALYRLTEIGLLQEAGHWAFVLHRLIWHFVRSQNNQEESQQAVDSVLSAEAKRINDTGVPESLLVWQEHLCFAAEEAWSRVDSRSIILSYVLGCHLHNIGEHEDAKQHYLRVVAVMERIADNDPLTATCLTALGQLLQDMGELAESITYHKRALAIYEVADSQHSNTATCLNNLGLVLQDLGEYEAAKLCYERAKSIFEKSLGKQHPETAGTLNNLGALWQRIGEYETSKSYYKRALTIYQNVLGNEHPNTAASLNNLGHVLQLMGQYAKAKQYYERAFAIFEAVFSEQHPKTALCLITNVPLQSLKRYSVNNIPKPLYALTMWGWYCVT